MIRAPSDPDLTAAVRRRRDEWRQLDGTARIWSRDGSLWTDRGENEWLGWLDIDRFGRFELVDGEGDRTTTSAAALCGHLVGAPFERCLLLGMGGSALGADLLWRTLRRRTGAGYIVLDTTDPREIASAIDGVDPAMLRVIAASRSGATLETRLAFEFLLDHLGDAAPAAALAITDAGSALEVRARSAGVPVVFGHSDVGGRFSVLSAFGLAPAAVAGIDLGPLLESARSMSAACRQEGRDGAANPGVELGLYLAAAHDCRRDKLYLHAPEAYGTMIAWVEQLLAESLGKGEILLLPVEAAGLPAAAAPDRLDIVLGSGAGDGPPAGGPVVRIEADLPAALGGELFRWQFATAVAGALLGVNPFDQPDVESSKAVTRRYVERMKAGSVRTPGGLVRLSEVSPLGLAELLGTHLAAFPERGHAVVSAYLDRSRCNRELLRILRRRIAGATGAAAVLGFGPSFLHSTGQVHKGGPNRGLFLQITAEPPTADVPVPGEDLTFGQVQLAQAWGDYDVLVERGRQILAVHIDGDVTAGLRRLIKAVG